MSDDGPAEEGTEQTPAPPAVSPPLPPRPPPPDHPPTLDNPPPPDHPPPAYPQGPDHLPPSYPPFTPGYLASPPGPADAQGRPMAMWWQRLVAFAVDLGILAIPNSIVVSAIVGTTASTGANINLTPVGPRIWEAMGVALVVSLGFFSFLDGSQRGQTVGKMVLGIAVRDAATGGPVGAGRALARRFFFFATYLGFGILFVANALSPLWDPQRRAWHDKMVGSCVVSVR